MATLLAASAASAAGYVIGTLASKPASTKKHGRRKTSALPPLPPLPPQPVPFIAPAPMGVYMSRAPPLYPPRPYAVAPPAMPPFAAKMQRPFSRPMGRTVPPPPPLPRTAPALSGGQMPMNPTTPQLPRARHTDTNSCPVCTRKYESGDVIARMWCEHMVHKACLERMINRDVVEDMKCECPHCGSKSYITRFAVAEKARTDNAEALPGLMPAPDNGPMLMQQAWDPARVSPVFFGRFGEGALTHAAPQATNQAAPYGLDLAPIAQPTPVAVVPVKGIVVTDDLSPLPASAVCTGNNCTPFSYSLRGGGPSCTLCDCHSCKRGQNCRTCGKCMCSNCKGVDCECVCQCADEQSQSVSALSFSDTGSVASSSYSASYNASSAPNSSAMFSSITPSMFNRFAYQ